jgi:hypothetical protein
VTSSSRLGAILADYGVVVVPTTRSRSRQPRETCAGATLSTLLASRGEAHLRDVLAVILESENNGLALVEPVIKAVSAVLLAHAELWEQRASSVLAVVDRINLVEMHEQAKANRGAAKPADAIATLLHQALAAELGEPRKPTLFDRGAQ